MRNLLVAYGSIKGRTARPEIAFRKILGTLKVKYELHRPDLPGKPDIVLTRRKKLIFVHGCFWHMHRCRYGRVKPAKNWRFWRDKREKNRARDRRNLRKLKRIGWKVLILWECWNDAKLLDALTTFLSR